MCYDNLNGGEAMPEFLIIYVDSIEAQNADAVILDQLGVVLECRTAQDPHSLQLLAAEREVSIIIPGTEVLLTHVNLPAMNKTKMMAALAYALEEQLITEVDLLHFAIGSPLANQERPVLIIARHHLEQWLNLFAGWHVKAHKIIPLSLALPVAEGEASLLLHKQVAALRMNLYEGWICDVDNVQIFLEKTVLTDKILQVYNHQLSINIKTDVPMKVQEIDDEALLKLLAQNILKFPTINLLQGDYAVKSNSFLQINRLWKVTGMVLLSFILLIFSYPIISYAILKMHTQHLQNEIAIIYKHHFPKATNIIEPKKRLAQKLNYVSNDDEKSLLVLLAYISKIAHTTNMQISRMEYQQKSLSLEISAPSAQEFSAIIDYLKAQGLQVKQQNAILNNGGIQSTIVID